MEMKKIILILIILIVLAVLAVAGYSMFFGSEEGGSILEREESVPTPPPLPE